jgi:hypothetical protein
MKFLSRLVEIKILSITQVVNYIASSAGNSLAKIDKSIMNKKIGKNVNIIGLPYWSLTIPNFKFAVHNIFAKELPAEEATSTQSVVAQHSSQTKKLKMYQIYTRDLHLQKPSNI